MYTMYVHTHAYVPLQADVKVLVLELCVYTGGLRQHCSAIVNDNWEAVWLTLLSEVVCVGIGL